MKIYERNRDGKPYPVFEINAIDLVQQYIEHCDVEQFIADYIGEDRFLKVAVQAIKDSYASTTTDPNILKAKGELADALGFQYAKAMADDFAYKSATDEYYAEMFRRLYQAINNFASEKNSGWYQFWSRYCTENPEVRIGDREWSAMQDMYRKEVWHRVESRMADVLQQHGKHDVKKALWRPIETAPKTGEKILVYRPVHDGDYIPVTGEDYWGSTMFDPEGCWMRSRQDCPPTHWMPLPKPPKGEQNG